MVGGYEVGLKRSQEIELLLFFIFTVGPGPGEATWHTESLTN